MSGSSRLFDADAVRHAVIDRRRFAPEGQADSGDERRPQVRLNKDEIERIIERYVRGREK